MPSQEMPSQERQTECHCQRVETGLLDTDGCERLDPRLGNLALRVQCEMRTSPVARVFIRASRLPFHTGPEGLSPAIPGLEPGFVTDAEGRILAAGMRPEAPPGPGPYLFTARVWIDPRQPPPPGGPIALPALLRQEGILWVGAAPRLRPQLDWSMPEIGATPRPAGAATAAAAPPRGGRGVVIGVADYGCDIAHANFRHADGRTRLLALWDQNPAGAPAEGLPQGREHAAAAIDAALDHAASGGGCPYDRLGYDPHANYYTEAATVAPGQGAHGTHVLDVAAGNGRGTGLPGLAPEAELVFVQLPRFDWNNAADLAQGAWVYEAAAYIFHKAGDRPAVVNLSLTTNTGPHDGSNLVEQALEALLRRPGRAIVVCAGNARTSGIHAGGTVPPGEARPLRWLLPPGDHLANRLLLCHAADAPLSVSLLDPAGREIPLPPPGQGRHGAFALRRGDGALLGTVGLGQDDGGAAGGRPPLRQIRITLPPSGAPETQSWTLLLRAGERPGERPEERPEERPVRFDAWIERDDPSQSRFDPADADRAMTLGSLACGESAIVVGAYNALAQRRRPAAQFSAEGPTRDGRQKPDLIAPGVGIYAARSKGRCTPGWGGGLSPEAGMVLSGTSQAAPHVAGAVALMLERAREAGGPLPDAARLRDTLRRTGRRDSLTPVEAWDAHAGCGRLDLRAALAALGEAS